MFLPSKAVLFPVLQTKTGQQTPADFLSSLQHAEDCCALSPTPGSSFSSATALLGSPHLLGSPERGEKTPRPPQELSDGQSESEVGRMRRQPPSASGLTSFAPRQSQRPSPCSRQVVQAPPRAPREEADAHATDETGVCVCVCPGGCSLRVFRWQCRLAEITMAPPLKLSGGDTGRSKHRPGRQHAAVQERISPPEREKLYWSRRPAAAARAFLLVSKRG